MRHVVAGAHGPASLQPFLCNRRVQQQQLSLLLSASARHCHWACMRSCLQTPCLSHSALQSQLCDDWLDSVSKLRPNTKGRLCNRRSICRKENMVSHVIRLQFTMEGGCPFISSGERSIFCHQHVSLTGAFHLDSNGCPPQRYPMRPAFQKPGSCTTL
jgi:hypothetical protein